MFGADFQNGSSPRVRIDSPGLLTDDNAAAIRAYTGAGGVVGDDARPVSWSF